MRAALDAIDIVEQRPQQRAVWRRHHHEVHSRSPLLPFLAQLLRCLVVAVYVNLDDETTQKLREKWQQWGYGANMGLALQANRLMRQAIYNIRCECTHRSDDHY